MLCVLISSNPCMALMFTAVAPVLPGMAEHYSGAHDGAFVAQMVMTMPSIGIVIGGLLSGYIGERIGLRNLLLMSLATYAFSGAAGALISDLWLMLALRFMLGIAASGVATSTLALIGERYSETARGRILGLQSATGSVVGLISLLAAGSIGEEYGWKAPFVLYIALSVVLFAAIFVVDKPISRSTQTNSSIPNGAFTSLLWVYGLIVLVFMAVFMNAVQLSFLLADDGIRSPRMQSWIMACSALASTAGAMSFGWFRSRMSSRAVFVLCLAFMGNGYVILGLSHVLPLTILGVTVAAFGGGCAGPYLASILLNNADPSIRGRAAGFLYTALYLGDFLNPLVVNPLRGQVGLHGVFVLVGCVLAASSVYVLMAKRNSRL